MPNELDLLLNGFVPSYTVPDADAPFNAAIDAAQETRTATGPTIADLAARLAERVNALAARLAPARYATANVVDPVTEELVTLPTPEQYQAWLMGSPTLEQCRSMELYDAHHVSESGNLDVWLVPYADMLSSEIQSLTDPADGRLLQEYFQQNASYMEQTLSALEVAAAAQLPEVDTSVLSGHASLHDIASLDVAELTGLRTELVQMRNLLLLLYHAQSVDLLQSVTASRQWAMNALNRQIIRMEMDAVTRLYETLLKPTMAVAADWERQTYEHDGIRFDILIEIRQSVLESLYGELASVKQELVDLVKADRDRHHRYQNVALFVQKKKTTRGYAQALEKAVTYIDGLLSDPVAVGRRTAGSLIQRPKGQ